MITITEAIQSLVPNAPAHYVRDNKIIGWDVAEIKNGVAQPTQEEIDAEIIRLQAEYDSQEYARKRKDEYPSMADQLDDIYHNGIDGWKATIKTTKDKYPKG